jgi:hypothetical protein
MNRLGKFLTAATVVGLIAGTYLVDAAMRRPAPAPMFHPTPVPAAPALVEPSKPVVKKQKPAENPRAEKRKPAPVPPAATPKHGHVRAVPDGVRGYSCDQIRRYAAGKSIEQMEVEAEQHGGTAAERAIVMRCLRGR